LAVSGPSAYVCFRPIADFRSFPCDDRLRFAPELGDETLCAFDADDLKRPYEVLRPSRLQHRRALIELGFEPEPLGNQLVEGDPTDICASLVVASEIYVVNRESDQAGASAFHPKLPLV
jgi:hypothetical protein